MKLSEWYADNEIHLDLQDSKLSRMRMVCCPPITVCSWQGLTSLISFARFVTWVLYRTVIACLLKSQGPKGLWLFLVLVSCTHLYCSGWKKQLKLGVLLNSLATDTQIWSFEHRNYCIVRHCRPSASYDYYGYNLHKLYRKSADLNVCMIASYHTHVLNPSKFFLCVVSQWMITVPLIHS